MFVQYNSKKLLGNNFQISIDFCSKMLIIELVER
jgi:hypothetical protein